MTSFLERDAASDLDLIADVRAGRSEAVAELYQRHHPAAIRFARGLTDPATADDIVADAFVRVWDAIRGGNGPTIAFRPYLLTAVRHCFASHVRRDARHVWVDDHDGPLDVATDPHQRDLRDESTLLASAFSALPERWQAVLWHTAVEGEDHDVVGRRLGLRPNAVAALSFRARDGLRKAYLAAHLGTADDECRPYHEQLATHVRGKLRSRQREAVERHLDECRSCTAAYLELVALNSHLGGVLAPAVLGAGAATYAAGAASGTAFVGSGAWELVRRVPRPAAAAATAAAVAVVGAGAFAVVSAIDGPDPAGEPAAALAPAPEALGGPGGPGVPSTDPTLATTPASEQAHAGRDPSPPALEPARLPSAAPSPTTPSAAGTAPTTGTVGSQPQPSSPTTSTPAAQPPPTAIGSPTAGPLPEPPPATPTWPSPDPDVTQEDLALGAASHTYYGPHHHLQMSVSSTAASAVLVVDVLGLVSYEVHDEAAYLPSTCAPTGADAGRTVLTCHLGAVSGTFAIDVVVSGALDASMRITAAGNADPDPDNDELRFTG